MTKELDRRKAEVLSVIEKVVTWAKNRSDIEAVAFVGSWARDAGRIDSDVDLLILTEYPEKYTSNDVWLDFLGGPPVIRCEQWGPVTERRIMLSSGLEVEIGISTREWASISPLDAGTLRVVSDGMQTIYDPHGILRKLSDAVALAGNKHEE